MAFNFPSPANNGDTYTSGTVIWTYDGTRWQNTGMYGPTGPYGAAGAGTSNLPKITSVTYTDSSYTSNGATSVSSSSGGYIKLTGTNFTTGCTATIDTTTATTTTYVSSTQVNVAVPALAAGTYFIYLTLTDGGVAIKPNGIVYV